MLAVRSVSLDDLDVLIARLGDMVSASGFEPDCVLLVERAGRIPGILLARQLGSAHLGARASRSGRDIKQLFRGLLAALPEKVKRALRRLEMASGIQGRATQRRVELPAQAGIFDRILIVDDSIDTGQTIRQVIDELRKMGDKQKEIKVAVINTTETGGRESVLKPNYVLYPQIIMQFPWSTDSKEYSAFLKRYKEFGSADA